MEARRSVAEEGGGAETDWATGERRGGRAVGGVNKKKYVAATDLTYIPTYLPIYLYNLPICMKAPKAR